MGNCEVTKRDGTKECKSFNTERECFDYGVRNNLSVVWYGSNPCPTTLFPPHQIGGGNYPYPGSYTHPMPYHPHPHHLHHHHHHYYYYPCPMPSYPMYAPPCGCRDENESD